MNPEIPNKQLLYGESSLSSHIGSLGIEIYVAGSELPNLAQLEKLNFDDPFIKNLRHLYYDFVHKLRDELVAGIIANDKTNHFVAEALDEKTKLLSCFPSLIIYVEAIPNGYDSSGYSRHLPWFKVTTTKGRITIGWRKHVINIDWSELDNKKKAEELFPTENVTKGDYDIHAWGYEKAKEYVAKILA